jgi:diguanylate cyclase (GGDEF)-like protein/PAS domain S-box-containing protein
MSNLTSYIKQMSFGWFVSIFISLVIGISGSLIVLQSYLLYGKVSPEILTVGLTATAITAITLITAAGLVFEQLRAEDKELQLAARVFNDAHEGIVIVDMNNTIIDINPTFTSITEYSREELIGKSTDILISNNNKGDFYLDIWRALDKRGHWKGEIWNRKKSGQLFIGRLTISSLFGDDGETLHYLCLVSDMTQSQEQQKKLEFMAHYDVLTKLPNRAYFAERFKQAVSHSKRTKSLLAICFLDLDHFKPINDNFGHSVGDQLLIEVSQRIKINIRENDTVSRLGGDEFALLLGDLNSVEECDILLTRIHNTLAQPYIIENKTLIISASGGVTIYPQDKADPDTLLRHADQAMYKAKLSGRSQYQFFNAHDDELLIQKHHQLQEIKNALTDEQFQLHYQPKINMKTGEVYGAEALLRWHHPDKGVLPPLDFLPLLENSELEVELGFWVIKAAVKQLEIWKHEGLECEVSINISSHHLQSPSFFSQLSTALDNHPTVDSKYLQLEILESSALSDLSAIAAIINTCHDNFGVSIALDDFGTGYSSLNHLRHLKANTVKVDRSFVKNMLDNPNDYAIVDGVISLADTFNREVIAEGVETTEHGLMLLVMGCERAQGFGISPPMQADLFSSWVDNYQANVEWLNCNNTITTTEHRRLKLFKLITQQWVKQFTKNIKTAPEKIDIWPTMKQTRCHCGTWIKRSRKENIFDEEYLNNLEQAHVSMHRLASELKEKYLSDDIAFARNGVKKLEATLEGLVNLSSNKNENVKQQS